MLFPSGLLRRAAASMATIAVLATITVGSGGVASAAHGATQTSGTYRLPYADGLSVQINNDSHNHNTAYDMTVGEDAQIVAMASGWIRAIVDYHGQEPNPGDGLDAQTPPQPQDDDLEHACGNNDPADTVATSCGDHNNYVWIEHPNGEYTKYSHLGTGTVSANWVVDDWIDAGEVIGLENDIGAASSGSGDPDDRAFHVHVEAAVSNTPGTDLTWSTLGGFIQNGSRVQIRFCDIAGNDVVAGNSYTANPCSNNTTPTADAGGPYVVDEGSSIMLDGTGSSDPEGRPLTYAWAPDTNLDDGSLAQPTFSGVDDAVMVMGLTVFDQVEAWSDVDFEAVVVNNVAPTVAAVGDVIDEGQTATVSATFTDPGVNDSHTAAITWGDGGPPENVSVAALTGGVDHSYGDNGTYVVTVTVVDDDGGVGQDTVEVVVGNVAPTLTLDTSGAVAFPGGDFVVADPGGSIDWAADGTDPGSDDLTFAWSSGEVNLHFNDGLGPDGAMSPGGVFPFAAADAVVAIVGDPGEETVSVTLSDDDGGTDDASASIIVLGTADDTRGGGWWKHQFSGKGRAHLDDALLNGYLETVNAVSSVFSEDTPLSDQADAHAVLSPHGGDKSAVARSALLQAWLHYLSGAVELDALVSYGGGTLEYLDLMFVAESVVQNPATTNGELISLIQDLNAVRHA